MVAINIDIKNRLLTVSYDLRDSVPNIIDGQPHRLQRLLRHRRTGLERRRTVPHRPTVNFPDHCSLFPQLGAKFLKIVLVAYKGGGEDGDACKGGEKGEGGWKISYEDL
ncbi:hypothetical protein U1Q18_012870 [Sarracenia purpurea var. burkii]